MNPTAKAHLLISAGVFAVATLATAFALTLAMTPANNPGEWGSRFFRATIECGWAGGLGTVIAFGFISRFRR
jgi:hypothetical protein